MAIFTWSDKFLTGITEIDDQHKKLVSLVNDLHDAMKNQKAKEILDKTLQDLADYTVYHFATEERAFDKYGYSEKVQHKKNHAEFVQKVTDLIERRKKSEMALSIDVLTFVSDWVKTHILVEDMKYLPELKGKLFT